MEGVFTVAGFGFGGGGQNVGLAFIPLKPFAERDRGRLVGPGGCRARDGGCSARSVRPSSLRWRRRRSRAWAIPTASTSTLQDVNGAGHDAADRGPQQAAWPRRPEQAASGPGAPDGTGRQPQFADRRSTRTRPARWASISSDINSTLSTAWGSNYVNDFIDRGRVKPVYVQARCAIPHAARRSGQMVCAQCERRHGAVLGLRHRAVDLWVAAARAL